MSMLAEPKRKQKWSLNPRGKAWSQDTNKFGHKMLEKMGWSQGKGLGAHEDGMVEHVKVSHKNDSKGIGYKETDDQWTEHETNFTALLEALGGGEQQSDDIKLNSLEEKSQNSRARVHYKKFTRGKDLSRYSEKDLANIFGKKNLKEFKKTRKEKVELQNEPLQDTKDDGEKTEKSGLFPAGGLISDYFKKKLPNFGKSNGYVVGNNGILQKADDSESESEQRPSFGFGFNQENTKNETFEEESNNTFIIGKEESKVKSNFTSYVYSSDAEDGPEKKKKNKKKRNLDEDNAITPTKKKKLEINEVHEDIPIKKKKDKSKKKLQTELESGLSNPAFNPHYTPIKVEKHILEPIEESPSEFIDLTLNDTVGQVAESFEVKVQINNESTPIRMKSEKGSEDDSLKKRKKKKDKSEDMDISYQNEESLDQTINKVKTKKKKAKLAEETEEMNTSSLSISKIYHSEEYDINNSPKKDKKRKKTKTDSFECLDTALTDDMEQSATSKKKKSKTNVSDESQVHSSSFNGEKEQTAKSKKKKSKINGSQEGLDNPFFNMSIEEEESMVPQTENPYEIKIKEKKKKKKRKEEKESYALENPVFNGEDSMISRDVTYEAFEIKRKDKSKKKKKEKEENKGLDNPALNLNDTIDESCDLMLNVVATPIVSKDQKNPLDKSLSIQKVTSVKRRKSVRFSDVTRERIIPNKEELEQETLEDSKDIVEIEGKLNDSAELTYIDKCIQKKKARKSKQGLDNSGFDKQATSIEENITSISKTLDTYQAEIENDMNEAKVKSVEIEDIMVGEVGNPNGTNEILPDGTVKLKFKNAKFNKTARFIDGLTGAKKSYRHLIKGDIVMKFKESNLHEIDGYAVKAH